MKTFRELIEAKAKKPKIIDDLSNWLKVLYPDLEVKDDANFKPFKGKEPNGQTEYVFRTGADAQEMLKKLPTIKKYEKLYISLGGNVLAVDWKELAHKPN
jgi:hypothetical protein